MALDASVKKKRRDHIACTKATWRSRTAFTTAIKPICRKELTLATFVKLLDFRVCQQYPPHVGRRGRFGRSPKSDIVRASGRSRLRQKGALVGPFFEAANRLRVGLISRAALEKEDVRLHEWELVL